MNRGAEEKVGWVGVDEVAEGDLLFTARPGGLQTLIEAFGDRWRHVGIAAVIDGEMSICEVEGDTFTFRPLADMVPTQTAVGMARLGPDRVACLSEAVKWTVSMTKSENVYAWDDVILTGVLLVTRRRVPADMLKSVMRLVRAAQQAAVPHDGTSFTCSSFIYEAFARSGPGCKFQISFSAPRTRPVVHRNDGRLRVLEDVLSAPPDEAQEILDSYSLLELCAGISQPANLMRSTDSSQMDGLQFRKTVRSLIATVAGLVDTRPLPAQLEVGGRWVSPGDLWRMDEVESRGYLRVE